MFKKFFTTFIVIMSISVFSFGIFSNPTFAAKTDDTTTTTDPSSSSTNEYGISSQCTYFLGFTSWNCGVNINSTETLKTGVWTIAANVLTDLTVAAAYLVLGYVIYGGYLYITSAGDPTKVANGKKTLSHAFIGLAIVMCASIIMGAIRIALVGDDGNIGNCATETGCVDPNDMITNLITWVIGMAGVVAVIFVVYGGISYVTSSGDPAKLKQAKNMILYATIGLIIVALAEIITAFVSNMIRDASENAQINETIISKEVYEIKIN